MYKDYYSILDLTYTATQAVIKKNYRTLVKKWHPDINKNQDATSKMQEITEAYLILSDPDARLRYDIIHTFYFREKKKETEETNFSRSNEQTEKGEKSKEDIPKTERQATPDVQNDPVLDDWILKAKQQATEFVRQSIKDVKGITANGCKYTAYAIVITIILFVVILIIVTVIRLTR